MALFRQNTVFEGLGTFSVVVPNAAMYRMHGNSSIPTITAGAGVSALVTTVNLNGSPVYTGSAGVQGFGPIEVTAAAGDTIAVVYSSALAVDNANNTIKSTIEISQGL